MWSPCNFLKYLFKIATALHMANATNVMELQGERGGKKKH